MAKAIYAKVDKAYYQIDQSTQIPSQIVRMRKTHSQISFNETARELTASVWLSGIETVDLQTNRGMYNRMIEDLKANLITEIPTISNQFLVYIDYSIYNDVDEEINHSCTTKKIEGFDALLALGTAFNNECVYRQVKNFDPKIVFSVTNHIPFGIMTSSYRKKYTLKINDICILQSIGKYTAECFNVHNSIYENSFDYRSHTIHTLLQDNIPIYSTAAAGLDIGEFTVSFYPRKIVIDLHCFIANTIVAYDKQNVDDVLVENMNIKYPDPDDPIPDSDPDPGNPDDPEDPDDPDFPDPDEKPPADGNYEEDDNGFYHYYEKCLATTPDALLVVENDLPDNKYYPESMIHQNDVLADVPEIQVGDHVRYCTGFNVEKLDM